MSLLPLRSGQVLARKMFQYVCNCRVFVYVLKCCRLTCNITDFDFASATFSVAASSILSPKNLTRVRKKCDLSRAAFRSEVFYDIL